MDKRIPLPRYKVNDAIVWANYDEENFLIGGGFGKVTGGSYNENGKYHTVTGWYYTVSDGKDSYQVLESDVINSL